MRIRTFLNTNERVGRLITSPRHNLTQTLFWPGETRPDRDISVTEIYLASGNLSLSSLKSRKSLVDQP